MLVHQFRNNREYGHFPHNSGIPFTTNGDGQLSFGTLFDVHFAGIKLVSAQESEVPLGQIIHALLHKRNLFVGYSHVLHQVNLFSHLVGKAFWVGSMVTVEEGIFNFGTGIGLQNVILATEGISIVVGKMIKNGLHSYCFYGFIVY